MPAAWALNDQSFCFAVSLVNDVLESRWYAVSSFMYQTLYALAFEEHF